MIEYVNQKKEYIDEMIADIIIEPIMCYIHKKKDESFNQVMKNLKVCNQKVSEFKERISKYVDDFNINDREFLLLIKEIVIYIVKENIEIEQVEEFIIDYFFFNNDFFDKNNIRVKRKEISCMSDLLDLEKFDKTIILVLDLSSMELIAKEEWPDLSNLKELRLISSLISRMIDLDSFRLFLQKLSNLRRLWLHNNEISNINFVNHLLLTELMLDSNKIVNISAFYLPNIKNLYLSNNQISNIEVIGFLNQSLEYLDLSKNYIVNIKSFVKHESKKKKIILQNNGIKEIGSLSRMSMMRKCEGIFFTSKNFMCYKCECKNNSLLCEHQANDEVAFGYRKEVSSKFFNIRMEMKIYIRYHCVFEIIDNI